MNVFITDPPLVQQPALLDPRVHPFLAFLHRVLLTALVLAIPIGGWLAYEIFSELYTYGPMDDDIMDDPFMLLLLIAAISSVLGLLTALLLQTLRSLFLWYRRSLQRKPAIG